MDIRKNARLREKILNVEDREELTANPPAWYFGGGSAKREA